jgi:hypothetical protein
MNYKQMLTDAVKKFEVKKEHTPQDYIDFIVVANRVLKQGSGLVWSQVEEAVKDGLYGVGQWGDNKDEGPHWSDKPICDKSGDPI